MTEAAKRLYEEALQLDDDERELLATQLLISVAPAADDADRVQRAWDAEIGRRIQDAIDHPDDQQDWRAAMADIRRDVLGE